MCNGIGISAERQMSSVEDKIMNLYERYGEHREINDNIHGPIRFPDVIFKIIDTEEFQRLREIKQLGCCYLVFHGAQHKRFEHSLGVCYMARKMIRVLRRKQPELGITDKDELCVMMAGLCHDLGHGPFSHVYDCSFVPMRPGEKWTHEMASVKMFRYLREKNDSVRRALEEIGLDDSDFTFIEECIEGPVSPESEDDSPDVKWPYVGRKMEKSFLYDIISNKKDGFDVDRYDYFLRDSDLLGVDNAVGRHTVKRLIKNARVYKVGANGRMRICYPGEKAREDANVFFWHHKLRYTPGLLNVKTIVNIFRICDILRSIDGHIQFEGDDGKNYDVADCMKNMGAYVQLTDAVLYLIKYLKKPELVEAKNLLRRLERRQLYKKVGDVAELPDEIGVGINQGQRDLAKEIAHCSTSGPIDPDKIRIYFPSDLPRQHNIESMTVFCCDNDNRELIGQIFEAFENWCRKNVTTSENSGRTTPLRRCSSSKREITPELPIDDAGRSSFKRVKQFELSEKK